MNRPTVNISRGERAGRVLVGAVAAWAGALLLLRPGGGPLATLLEVLLSLTGLDLVVTGAFGHCPLYKKLGHVPASLTRPR